MTSPLLSLISSAELIEKLAGGELSIVDARKKEEYDEGHIPGAVHLAWEDFCQAPPPHAEPVLRQPGYWGKLDDSAFTKFAVLLADRGLSNQRPIVVYDNGLLSKGSQGRIAWMLLYFGARQMMLLDGGWPAWFAAGGGITKDVPPLMKGGFEMRLQPERRALLEDLKAALELAQMPLMIDTRSILEFAGQCYQYQPRMGRMPGSILVPFEALFDDSGSFVDRATFTNLLPTGTSCISSSQVSYCEVGVRAATFALLYEVHTNSVLPVYDGSLMEWSLEHSLPMLSETGCGS